MDRIRKPSAGHLDTQVVYAHGKQTATITSNGTTIIPIATPYRKCYVERMSLQADVIVGFSAGGAAQCQIFKKPTGVSAQAISNVLFIDNNHSFATDVAAQTTVKFPFVQVVADAATDDWRTINEGEYLYLSIVTSAAVNTQPKGIIATVELMVLEQ
jgi:hypothetical protein